ncbi:DUF4305 domain-containing protein [Peribacillus saganii]|uniref:DUF4305 domain-containing protein n=1 Tax=Peribacillus saganii TaxID=2303992 RepID=A0A372LP10_9BACI|nr:YdiK family protein [Peribacillus saganii]RFU69241.1 DUF4305 domain-containing protein [Peribacillus saganii]
MKRTPLTSGIMYLILGTLFVLLAIQNVNRTGWGFFSYFLVLLATLDFGSGIRMILLHRKITSINKKNK